MGKQRLEELWEIIKVYFQFGFVAFIFNLIFSFVSVAMNYQTEGRMLELNQAKFSINGNCGYILKPKCMCKGMFHTLE